MIYISLRDLFRNEVRLKTGYVKNKRQLYFYIPKEIEKAYKLKPRTYYKIKFLEVEVEFTDDEEGDDE